VLFLSGASFWLFGSFIAVSIFEVECMSKMPTTPMAIMAMDVEMSIGFLMDMWK
jgi:hypothetical protein